MSHHPIFERYTEYASAFRAIAIKLTRDESLWEDLIQEAFLRFCRPVTLPDTNADAFYRQVARNAMIDHLRTNTAQTRRIISLAQAKRAKLLRCPTCGGNELAWTIHWPGAVRCRSCLDTAEIEGTYAQSSDVTPEDTYTAGFHKKKTHP